MIEQHKLIVERCKSLLIVSLEEDKEYLEDMINHSQMLIDEYNKENLTAIDISKRENGCFTGTVKKIIKGAYLNDIYKQIGDPPVDNHEYICESHYKYYEEWKEYLFVFEDFCESCVKESKKREKESKDYYEKIDKVRSEFNIAAEKTVYDKELISKYTIYRRKLINPYFLTPLEKVLGDTIRLEMLRVFQEQNKQLINKYN